MEAGKGGETRNGDRMKRVVVERFGGPEVLKVIEEGAPQPGPGEVLVRVLAAGVSFTDAQMRAGTYIRGAPKPPFTPGYELVGVVEELGPDCTRLKVGDRIGALTVWGADADRVCVPETGAVEVPEDLDPAEVLSLLFPYMTAYQVLHRTAKAKSGETVLVHGAAGRVGVAALEIGAAAGLRLLGTCSARDRAKVEALGAVAIDYRNEDFLARVRELTDDGVDVVSDSLGGPISLRSFRALRPGGRLVVYGRYSTLKEGRKDWTAVVKWWLSIVTLFLWSKLSPRRHVSAYHVQKYRDTATRRGGAVGGEPMDPEQFREDFQALLVLLREDKVHPVVAERLPLSEARRAHELLEGSASKGKLVLVPRADEEAARTCEAPSTKPKETKMAGASDVVTQHIEAFNGRDRDSDPWAAGAELVAPGGSVSGRDEVLGFLGVFQEAFPDGRLEVGRLLVDGSSAAAEGKFVGTHDGILRSPNGDVAPTGKSVELRWASAYEVSGEELTSEHLYFDQMDLLGQLGLLPG